MKELTLSDEEIREATARAARRGDSVGKWLRWALYEKAERELLSSDEYEELSQLQSLEREGYTCSADALPPTEAAWLKVVVVPGGGKWVEAAEFNRKPDPDVFWRVPKEGE